MGMTCATLRYAPWVYEDETKKIAHMPVIFALHPFPQWFASWFMEDLRMKLVSYNSNSASIFLCKISQTGISPASIRPFWILKFNLLPSTVAGKQNLLWFPRILCHSRRTRRFSMDFIMIFISRTKLCPTETKGGNTVKSSIINWVDILN